MGADYETRVDQRGRAVFACNADWVLTSFLHPAQPLQSVACLAPWALQFGERDWAELTPLFPLILSAGL